MSIFLILILCLYYVLQILLWLVSCAEIHRFVQLVLLPSALHIGLFPFEVGKFLNVIKLILDVHEVCSYKRQILYHVEVVLHLNKRDFIT
jgi:hypothetical protein